MRLDMILSTMASGVTQEKAAKRLGVSKSTLRYAKNAAKNDTSLDIYQSGWYSIHDKRLDDEIELLESMRDIMLALIHKHKLEH